MVRRKAPSQPPPDDTPPDDLTRCVVGEWIGPHETPDCDRDGRCSLNGNGDHDQWCHPFTARRRWYAARREWLTDHPDVNLPHSRPEW